MTAAITRGITAALVVLHVGLVVVGVAGLVQLGLDSPLLAGLEAPEFPDWMLATQWVAIIVGGAAFCVAVARKSRHIVWVMAGAYALMGGLCAIQTTQFLTHDARFVEMGVEFVEYAAILGFLAWRQRDATALEGTASAA